MKDTELSGTTFGRWVEEKRLRAGLSQEEAATRAEITRQQWNRIENGSSTKRDTVTRIALALGANIEEALAKAGFMPSESARIDADLQRLFDGLSDRQKQVVFNVAKATRDSLLTVA